MQVISPSQDQAAAVHEHCTPIESVEKALYAEYCKPDFPHRLTDESMLSVNSKDVEKKLFKALLSQQLMSRHRVYEFLCNCYNAEVEKFAQILAEFLQSKRSV